MFKKLFKKSSTSKSSVFSQQLDAGHQTINASNTKISEDDLRAFLAAATKGRLSNLRALNLSLCSLGATEGRILAQALQHLYVYVCSMCCMYFYA